ncbi:hypothetical protein DPMN_149987 [Dreissena polymorpha]|uniref:Uncharacterized protein n=1 Tax=Dreissena polymorpha TaxID=45954 RepID=A0A9D4FCF0_DREPO|nr:hypothetical protein DPMN_149987 [Dreissena polymorpha]
MRERGHAVRMETRLLSIKTHRGHNSLKRFEHVLVNIFDYCRLTVRMVTLYTACTTGLTGLPAQHSDPMYPGTM